MEFGPALKKYSGIIGLAMGGTRLVDRPAFSNEGLPPNVATLSVSAGSRVFNASGGQASRLHYPGRCFSQHWVH